MNKVMKAKVRALGFQVGSDIQKIPFGPTRFPLRHHPAERQGQLGGYLAHGS